MLNQINCPRCQRPFQAEIHQIIDAARQPELKYALLNGQINMFVCPNCGLSGQMASPLLYHDPEHDMFIVHVPMELNLPHTEQQRLIGQMVQQVMDATPAGQRRGYMLQPETILSMDTFMERVLGTEGVTPAMIARQRKQSELLQILTRADNDVVELLLQERADEIDETFFAMMQNFFEMAQQRQDEEQILKFTNLRAKLYAETEPGRVMHKRETALRRFQKEAQKENGISPDLLLKHILLNQEDESLVEAIVTSGQSALTYDFFTKLTNEIERTAKVKDKEQTKRLSRLRQVLLDFQKAIQEHSQQIMQKADQTLKAILTVEDKSAAIQEHLHEIDENFMYLLNALMHQAEQEGQQDYADTLRYVHELIIKEAEKQIPPEIRLINNLLRAETESEQRQLLNEHSDLVKPEMIPVLEAIGQEMAGDGRAEMGEKVQQIRGMIQARLALSL